MDKERALIHHEILNLITTINFELSAIDFKEEEKEKILQYLKLITLLIKYQDIFLKREKEILRTTINLNEILEAIAMIHERRFRRNKVKWIMPDEEIPVKVDRRLVQEALEQILEELMKHAKNITITCKNGTLKISHNSPAKLSGKKIDLMKCFTDKKNYPNFAYHLALHLLSLTGAKVTSEKGMIKISFQ